MLGHREHRRFSEEEYLYLEERATSKNEYIEGEIFCMSGGSLEHNRLVRNLLTELNISLRGKTCEVFPSDLRLHVKSFQLFTYPDILVVCGPPRLLAGRNDTLTDATLIVEVLSTSTQNYDRNEKFRYYRSLDSFSEYLLVSQEEVRVEQHSRQGPSQWVMTEQTSLSAQLNLSSIDVTLPLATLYQGVWKGLPP